MRVEAIGLNFLKKLVEEKKVHSPEQAGPLPQVMCLRGPSTLKCLP